MDAKVVNDLVFDIDAEPEWFCVVALSESTYSGGMMTSLLTSISKADDGGAIACWADNSSLAQSLTNGRVSFAFSAGKLTFKNCGAKDGEYKMFYM